MKITQAPLNTPLNSYYYGIVTVELRRGWYYIKSPTGGGIIVDKNFELMLA